ncbi:hypothetical protein FHS29_006368 [Saccharothrix tamanrassetensis]|uniref:J domain-containing protein n=1 Tax=Saccharothrix tamanrassetensis TaxID=1051531 RepID=A0A841CUP5_9PSEU|nr:J domain-containing protein [Saccharothrix tamanrassetensis]MBB5959747.1 hypothetical protein [Saccharothrix tamanrassetensis]
MSGPAPRDLDGHDPYELLGIPRTATRAEIVAAHRRQIRLVHPDRPGGDEYETKLLHIAKAVLLDPRHRADLDAARSRPDDEGPPGGWEDESPVDFDPSSNSAEAAEAAGSIWESEEVIAGVGPSPDADASPPQSTTGYWQQTYAPPPQPTYVPPPTYAPPPPMWQPAAVPVQPSVSAIPIVALVVSLACCFSPLGLVLGVIGLSNPKGRYDRPFSVAAIVLGSVSMLFMLLWVFSSAFTGRP